MTQARMTSIQKEIHQPYRKRSRRSSDIASNMKQVAALRSQINSTRNATSIASKLRQIETLENKSETLQREIAEMAERLAEVVGAASR